jgi:hypothetical protein
MATVDSRSLLRQIEHAHDDLDSNQFFSMNGRIFLGSREAVLDLQLEWYRSVLAPFAQRASCFVELGAGFGSKMLRLAVMDEFRFMRLIAGELTTSGCDLLRLCAASEGIEIEVGMVDLGPHPHYEIDIPKGALIFTSFALHYWPESSTESWEVLASLDPVGVAHFEPCYELLSPSHPLESASRSYIENHAYTRDIFSSLALFCRNQHSTLTISPNVFGENPLLPASALVWAP